MVEATVANLTVDELKSLIREVVAQTIREELRDPDEGLELREDFEAELRASLKAVEAGAPTRSAEEVAAKMCFAA